MYASGINGAYNGTERWNRDAQNLVRFTFNGDSIVWTYSKAYNRGIAAVTVDGFDWGTYSLYSQDIYRNLGYIFDGLGSGTHVININVTGDKDGFSTDTFIGIDSFIVQPITSDYYNRENAVSYADAHARNYNRNYPDYRPDLDCTNYLSQVLYHGGMPQRRMGYWGGEVEDWWADCSPGWCDNSDTWSGTPQFSQHISGLLGVRYQFKNSVTQLTGGDFFLMDLASNPYVGKDHARVIVGLGVAEEGNYRGQWGLLANQHTTDRKRVLWNDYLKPNDFVYPYSVIY